MVNGLITLREKLMEALDFNDDMAEGLINDIATAVNMYFKKFKGLRARMDIAAPIKKFDVKYEKPRPPSDSPPPYNRPVSENDWIRTPLGSDEDQAPPYSEPVNPEDGIDTDSQTGINANVAGTNAVAVSSKK